MKNNLHVFLGSTVADAAARPLHWVYNQKNLLNYIRGKKDFTFLKKNKSPFYSIKTGKVSGYNDIGQVMFKTLIEGHTNIESRFKKNIIKNFGPGSIYWKNYSLRAKYRKVKDWRGIIKGPWIHQNIIETVQNIKRGKKLTGGRKVNESDGFCAALPYFLYGYGFKNVKKIISLVTVSKISLKYALAKFHLIDLALKGSKDPIKEFTSKYKNNLYFKNIIETVQNIKKGKKLTGGRKVNESDGFCAALPYFLYGYSFKNLKKIISLVTVSKISIRYALAKFYLIDLALKGSKNPIKEFALKYKNKSYFKNIVKGINKIKRLKQEDVTVLE